MSRSTGEETKPELPHLSSNSKSATIAEVTTIRRLNREVYGLNLAMGTLMKNSKEWRYLNSKLVMAREELDAVVEDEQLFRSISPTGSGKCDFTSAEEQCFEILCMIPTPPMTEIFTASDAVKRLEGKLSQQTKYSFEWFDIKRQIAESKKKENSSSSVNPNKKFVRSSTTGSIATTGRRGKLIKVPSTGSLGTVTIKSNILASINDKQSIQCLDEQLRRVPKYSMEWFELKRIVSRRKNKKKHRKSYDSEQKNQDDPQKSIASSDGNISSSESNSSSTSSATSSQPQSHEQENRNCHHSNSDQSSRDQTSRTILDSKYRGSKQDQHAIQNLERLKDFLERVPKYSR